MRDELRDGLSDAGAPPRSGVRWDEDVVEWTDTSRDGREDEDDDVDIWGRVIKAPVNKVLG